MATHEETARFLHDWNGLLSEQQVLFMVAVTELVEDLGERRRTRSSLQIRELEGQPGVFVLSWSRIGRATFAYGAEQRPGEQHLVWRRIGGHEILSDP